MRQETPDVRQAKKTTIANPGKVGKILGALVLVGLTACFAVQWVRETRWQSATRHHKRTVNCEQAPPSSGETRVQRFLKTQGR